MLKDMNREQVIAFMEINDKQIKQGRKLGLRNLVKSCKQVNEKAQERLDELDQLEAH